MQISSSEYLEKKIDIHLYAIVSKTNFTCGKWKNITNIRVYKLVYTIYFSIFVKAKNATPMNHIFFHILEPTVMMLYGSFHPPKFKFSAIIDPL